MYHDVLFIMDFTPKAGNEMPKQLTISEIARLAGVSAGTVDRILHNRGKVSESARNAVGKILAESGYRNNIHSSAIGLRKGFRLAVAMPDSSRGEYWFSIREGINHALEEFSDIRIDCSFSLYNRNDIHSCREVFGQVSVSDADAVIICATNREETVGMCRCLGNRNIPYFMAGTEIPDTDPVASFSADQEASGRLAARLLSTLSAPPPHQENTNGNFAVILPQQTAACNTGTFGERKRGITEYFSGTGTGILEVTLPLLYPDECGHILAELLRGNPGTRGIAVLDSSAHVVADILSSHGFPDIPLIAFDMTSGNRRCLQAGSVSAVIVQYPEIQGYNSVKSAIQYLLYKHKDNKISHKMPIGIIVAENLPYYRRFNGM